MSDIQDLIHKTTMDCLERGRREEQERIIRVLEHMPRIDNDRTIDAPLAIELIKGETK